MMFQFSNGSTTMVNQVGGMLAYYLLYGGNVTAFPSGFQMIAGDQYLRNFSWPVPDPPKSSWSGAQSSQFALQQKALGFNCLDYSSNPEPSLYRHTIPSKSFMDENCVDGMRLEVMFPSCWNGKDVDSPDHKSHMAYPSLVMDGDCPKGFETRLVSLFFETIFDTYAFKGEDGQFVLANGDPTGCGYHGDFMSGWDTLFLQQAVDTCTNPSGKVEDCSLFMLQDDTTAAKCQFQVPDALKVENVFFDERGLPGNVPIQLGPAQATLYGGDSGASPTIGISVSVPNVLPTILSSAAAPVNAVPTSVGVSAHINVEIPQISTSLSSSSSSSTSTMLAPTPAVISSPVVYDIVVVHEEIIVEVGDGGIPMATLPGALSTVTTSTSTTSIMVTKFVTPTPAAEVAPVKREQLPGHLRPPTHGHGRRQHHRRGE
jgi:hypothetical protein